MKKIKQKPTFWVAFSSFMIGTAMFMVSAFIASINIPGGPIFVMLFLIYGIISYAGAIVTLVKMFCNFCGRFGDNDEQN